MQLLRTDPDLFGIRARLLTLLLPGIVGLLVLDSWNDYRALKHQLQDAYDQAMVESVQALRNSLVVGDDGHFHLDAASAVQARFDAANPPQRKHLHVSLSEPAGSANPTAPPGRLNLLGNPNLPEPPVQTASDAATPLVADPAQPQTSWYEAYYQDTPVRVLALQSRVVDGRGQKYDLLIQAAESTGPRDKAQDASLQEELVRDARLVLVMVLLVWLGVTWSLAPLERLRKSVLQSKGQDLKPMDTSDVPHEVAPLVDAINQHVASYRDLLDQQSQFLADASHQLRTPLAIMLTQAGFALREKDPEQLHATLRAIVAQISRSRRLCEQLLALAHASDNSQQADKPEVLDLNNVAKDVVLQYLTLAHEKNQDLGWMDARAGLGTVNTSDSALEDAPAVPVPVLARGPELHEVLANLVHNAIVYTPPGGHITVMVGMRDGVALAEVRDNGPGIAKARRAAVFERFHHSKTAKGQHGAGLGLAIARAYARRNHGDIELADAASATKAADGQPPVSGLRALLRLPLAAARPG